MKKYTKADLYEGMKLICVEDLDQSHWTVGWKYTVYKDQSGEFYLIEDDEDRTYTASILRRLNKDEGWAHFEVVDEPKKFSVTLTGDTYAEISAKACKIYVAANNATDATAAYERHVKEFNKVLEEMR